jgi:hypothetical protein
VRVNPRQAELAFLDYKFCSCVLVHNYVSYRPDGGLFDLLASSTVILPIININIGKTLQESVI